MKCPDCASTETVERRESAPHLTLPAVTLHGVPRLYCASCGASVGGRFEHPTQSAALIAQALVTKPRRLHGSKFRWLRKRMRLRGNDSRRAWASRLTRCRVGRRARC